MWEQYKKHFVGMQVVILLVTFAAYQRFSHLWFVAAVFFTTMQVGALLGASWANRIRMRVKQQQW
jgi:hydrogenase/urease accessory protein HupE